MTIHTANEKNGYGAGQEFLSVHGMKKCYGELKAVDGISFSVHSGEILALLGPNGAGKTTALDTVLGLKQADEGEFRYFGITRKKVTPNDLARIGVQLQHTAFFPELTVREVLSLFRSLYARGKDIEELIELFSLAEQTKKRVRILSGGQKQRLALACALINDPDLVFMDEPTTGIDTQNRRALWDITARQREAGKAVILTTHYMEEAESLADRVILIDHGRIAAQGTVSDLKAEYGKQTLEEVFLEITGNALRD